MAEATLNKAEKRAPWDAERPIDCATKWISRGKSRTIPNPLSSLVERGGLTILRDILPARQPGSIRMGFQLLSRRTHTHVGRDEEWVGSDEACQQDPDEAGRAENRFQRCVIRCQGTIGDGAAAEEEAGWLSRQSAEVGERSMGEGRG